MSPMEIDGPRQAILDSTGHVLIEGGPGCGKTTIALLKARQTLDSLEDEQRVLFLSFSRAAVRQITNRMSGLLNHASRRKLQVRTFHSFFMDIVRSHSRLLTGHSASFIAPDHEHQLRADFGGSKEDWLKECQRMAAAEGRYVFDLLAETAATLLESSSALRTLYSSVYPLVIVDEFQDTNIDQWRAVRALSAKSTVICLADPDQRIFGHIPGVDEERIAHAVAHLAPTTFDLSEDNYRSPEGGLLSYANAVLRNTAHPLPDSIRNVIYATRSRGADSVEVRTHYAIVALRQYLEAELQRVPTLAVLSTTNALVGRISETISRQSVTARGTLLPPVEHDLHWDPELAAAAGFVVASLLEWPGLPRQEALPKTLRAMADFYRRKLASGTAGARDKIQVIGNAITAFDADTKIKSKSPNLLISAWEAGLTLTGQPVADWQIARGLLHGSAELDELFKQVRLLRLFQATDALALALTDTWNGTNAYTDAASAVRRVLAADSLSGAERQTAPVSLMSMHRSKGKEFDGVVIVEGAFNSRLLDNDWDEERIRGNRRLLRVAITRARHMAVFVRPDDGVPLTP
ncbi:ATP-dependent helicase [Streptomyces narbonensis]|uniref:ATP-dependent helicase n=1 Tax=Streptomyces narbonensis TaxID=67333 RepID=UPI0033F6C673